MSTSPTTALHPPAAEPAEPAVPPAPRFSDLQVALLVAVGALVLFVPFAGSYGLWDPWETHYGEVARQMAVRGDWISLWWPGSPIDPDHFWSKPVFTFWLMALSLKLAGYDASLAPDGLARGSLGEWALRMPLIVMAVVALVGVFLLVSRFASRRAGILSALTLATMPLFALVTRQAMTDMAFLGPMTMALAMCAYALFDERTDDLPRRSFWAGGRRFELARHPLAYAALGLFTLTALPQIVVDSLQISWPLKIGSLSFRLPGPIVMLPYVVGFVGVFLLASRARTRTPFYFLIGGVLCALATLAKGLAGLGVPAIVFFAYLGFSKTWARLTHREMGLGILLGLLACAVVVIPWHHCMLIRHGFPFWDELYGDNHWRRLVIGRHGDRGTFTYFLRELGFAILPWLALAPAALVRALRGAQPQEQAGRSALRLFGAVWFISGFALVAASVTKFHHYILPALPGLAVVLGIELDEALHRVRRNHLLAAAFLGVPLLALVTHDLTDLPRSAQRFIWLFSYDYVNDPKGRPWPPELDFRTPLLVFGAAFALLTAVMHSLRLRRVAMAGLCAAALCFTIFLTDVFMRRVTPYWTQKGLIASYYKERTSAAEHLVAWQMYWRGENFYTQNQIYEGPSAERTVFLGAQNAENLKAWFGRNLGRRVFFVVERSRWKTLESLLPEAARPTLKIIDETNMKFALAQANL